MGDIIHEVDLHTTFARLGGALNSIPTDRIIDGIDQTALILEGDTHGRRDYVHIYQGPNLGATVKGNIKKHWIDPDPGAASGLSASFYDLLSDTREKNGMMVNTFHLNEAFVRARARHELWKAKYPDSPRAHGIAYAGLANARPETKALGVPPANMENLPFDVFEFMTCTPLREEDFKYSKRKGATNQHLFDSSPCSLYEEYEECFCEAAPRVKYWAPVSDEFSCSFYCISSEDDTERSQRGSSSFCSRSARATLGRRRIGGIRRVGSAISTTTVQRGQALSRACRTHTCEPAETIGGSFLEFQCVAPWTYAVALGRSATVTNRPASNSVPSRIIA